MAHDICLINIVFSFGHCQTHPIFFVGIGLPTGVNETKSAAFLDSKVVAPHLL